MACCKFHADSVIVLSMTKSTQLETFRDPDFWKAHFNTMLMTAVALTISTPS